MVMATTVELANGDGRLADSNYVVGAKSWFRWFSADRNNKGKSWRL